ncbi:MAG: hypothetical protein LBI10_12795 [Deltaproteobacteria bacterium]|jgi:hypothetical protein|nr:hypothetical protein [Deltaproteobacteria bacterium]
MAFSTDHFLNWTDKHGKKQHRILQREYTSLVGDSLDFTKMFFSLAIKNGYRRYKNTVLISDGATWIRNMKNYIFPDVQQILDFYHLKEHVADYFKQVFNFNEEHYLKYTEIVCNLFKDSKSIEAIKIIKKLSNKKDKYILENILQYIDNNKDNIDYKNYRLKGYFIGSGAIESSNKTVLQRCLKYGAMRWNIASAQAVVTLVAKSRSGLWKTDVVDAVYKQYGDPKAKGFSANK